MIGFNPGPSALGVTSIECELLALAGSGFLILFPNAQRLWIMQQLQCGTPISRA